MNTTTTTAGTAKAAGAPAKQAKATKPQRRIARPAPSETKAELNPSAVAPPSEPAPAPATGSKTAGVIALLSREQGAAPAELIEATGWLPHTMRAALTGLRKKGHTIERGKRGTETCYTIKEATAP